MYLNSLADTVAGYFAGTCGYKIEYDLPGHPREYTVNSGLAPAGFPAGAITSCHYKLQKAKTFVIL